VPLRVARHHTSEIQNPLSQLPWTSRASVEYLEAGTPARATGQWLRLRPTLYPLAAASIQAVSVQQHIHPTASGSTRHFMACIFNCQQRNRRKFEQLAAGMPDQVFPPLYGGCTQHLSMYVCWRCQEPMLAAMLRTNVAASRAVVP
jgi:hypothetical protein